MKLNHSYSAFAQFKNCPLRYYRQRVIKDVKDPGGVASIEGDRQHKALEKRIAFAEPLPADMSTLEPLCAAIEQAGRRGSILPEKEMALTQKLEPTGWWDSDAWFRCKADLLVINSGDTHAVILDYKTGKRRPDFLQMELMAMASMIYYPKLMDVDTMFVWLKDLVEDSKRYTRAELPHLIETLLANVARIETAVDKERWPAKPSGLCNYCPCQPTCKWG